MRKSKYIYALLIGITLQISGFYSVSAQGIQFQNWVDQVKSVLQQTSGAVLKLADTPWPFIHHDPMGTKSSPFCAPKGISSGSIDSKTVTFEPSIVNLHGRQYLYVQGALTGTIYAMDPEKLGDSAGIINTFSPGANYPYSGGGVIDSNHRLWWTNETKLIRVDENLSNPMYSVDLPSGVWNGATILSDGNMLVTGNQLYTVVGTQESGNSFPILNQGNFPFPTQSGTGSEEGLGPRPVTDGTNHFYFVTPTSIQRVTYDTNSKSLLKSPDDWGITVPSGITLGVSNAILVGDKVCANSDPQGMYPMYVLCYDKNNGNAYPMFQPFPGASDIESTWHTLGSVPEENLLIVIGSSPSGSGGITAFQMSDFTRRWYVSLPNVSNALAISSQSKRLYLSARKNLLSDFQIHSIGSKDGSDSIIYSEKIQGMPGKSLGIVGLKGNIFIPYALGMIRLRDKIANCL